MTDRDRLKLFNELCKMCSRLRIIPKSMHVPGLSTDDTQVQYGGGFSITSEGTYEGYRVAIKVLHVYSNNLNTVINVSDLQFTSTHAPV